MAPEIALPILIETETPISNSVITIATSYG
jgi:hypothetical protein